MCVACDKRAAHSTPMVSTFMCAIRMSGALARAGECLENAYISSLWQFIDNFPVIFLLVHLNVRRRRRLSQLFVSYFSEEPPKFWRGFICDIIVRHLNISIIIIYRNE